MKNKTNECKKLINYIPLLFYCKIYRISSLTSIKFKKTTSEKFDFVHFLSFFFGLLKNYSVYANIPHTYMYQTTALLPGILFFWFRVAYELRLVSYRHETAGYCLLRHFSCLVVDFCLIIPGVARTVRPHPDY